MDALIAILILLKEPCGVLFTDKQDDGKMEPHIYMSGAFECKDTTFTIYVDGELVATVNNAVDAAMLHYAIFFIMDITYPTKLINFMSFIQKIVMRKEDSIKERRKVLTLLKKIMSTKL